MSNPKELVGGNKSSYWALPFGARSPSRVSPGAKGYVQPYYQIPGTPRPGVREPHRRESYRGLAQEFWGLRKQVDVDTQGTVTPCEYCGQPLPPNSRKSRKYCSDGCKKAAYAERRATKGKEALELYLKGKK